MTHQELLNKLAYTPHTDPNGERMHKALRAIVELHKPFESTDAGWLCNWCYTCNFERTGLYMDIDMYSYPCPTIQAIEKELA